MVSPESLGWPELSASQRGWSGHPRLTGRAGTLEIPPPSQTPRTRRSAVKVIPAIISSGRLSTCRCHFGVSWSPADEVTGCGCFRGET
jgi:hypothetical protein